MTVLGPTAPAPIDDLRAENAGAYPEPDTARSRVAIRPLGIAFVGYLVPAIVLWWNVWSSHPTSTTTCGCGDSSLFTWFIEWPAYALSHGQNPLFSTAMFHPVGVNLLANTSELAVGILLAPVTWLFGPVATLNVALTASPILSALAMFILARRWVAWAPAAFVAGFLYGFAPFVIVNLTDAHLMNAMLLTPPLMVACLDELLMRQRHRPARVGIALGLLIVLQFFLGTELLVMMAMTGLIGLIVVVGYAALHDREDLRRRTRHAMTGLGTAAGLAAVVLAYPTWFAVAGPAHLSGLIWPNFPSSFGGTTLGSYLVPNVSSRSFADLMHSIGGYQGGALPDALYLGPGMLVVLVVGLAAWRHDRRLWLFSSLAVVTVALSLAVTGPTWVPWRLFDRLPILENVIPSRFDIMTNLSVAILLALVLDHLHRAIGRLATRVPALMVALVAATVAVLPIEITVFTLMPLTVVPVMMPPWFTQVAPRLPPRQVALVYPVAFADLQGSMTWQAVSGMRYSMVGGGGPESVPSRAGIERPGYQFIAASSVSYGPPPVVTSAVVGAVRHALTDWGVTIVVIPNPHGLPLYDQPRHVPYAIALITEATGQRPVYQAHAWVWDRVTAAGPPAIITPNAFTRCVAAGSVPDSPTWRTSDCVLAGG